jgi:hypothetical protein
LVPIPLAAAADSTGDLFFYLMEVMVVPLACEDAKHEGHSCTNPEAAGKDLMVRYPPEHDALTSATSDWFIRMLSPGE